MRYRYTFIPCLVYITNVVQIRNFEKFSNLRRILKMAKLGLGNSGKFASSNGNDFFTLENDGDSAEVTFLYDDPDGGDIDYFLVHEVEIGGKRRYVNCNALDDDGEHLHPENCPLCENGYPRIEKLFLQLYNHGSQKVETWDRGRTYVPKITTYINRYKKLVTQPFELIRNGKKGDTNTSYEFLPMDKSDETLEDFPEKQNLLGAFILDVTADEMFDMVDGRYQLPGRDDSAANANSRAPRGRETRSSSSAAPRARQSQAAPKAAEPRTQSQPRAAQQSSAPASRPRRASGGPKRAF